MRSRRLIPPVALLVAFGALAWALHYATQWRLGTELGAGVAAAFVLLIGAATAALGVAEFRRAQTTVDPTRPERATTIVASGIYRYTRNPMYAGFAAILLAWCILLRNPLALVAGVAFVLYLDRVQIPAEEAALRQRFGAAFDDYAGRVRRWL